MAEPKLLVPLRKQEERSTGIDNKTQAVLEYNATRKAIQDYKPVQTPELDAAVGNTPDFVAPSQQTPELYKATFGEKAGYVGRQFVGGALESTKNIANDWSYKAQASIPEQQAENTLALYQAGGTDKYIEAARESYNREFSEAEQDMQLFMGNAQHFENYLAEYVRKAVEEERKDVAPVKAVDWGEGWDEQTQNKYGNKDMGTIGQIAGDVSRGAGGMVPYYVTSFIPGVGQAVSSSMLFSSASGGAIEQALAEGATMGEAMNYGTLVGATELLTEKLFGGVARMFGKGAVDDVVESAVRRIAKSDAGRTAFRMFLNSAGESAEEMISEAVNPILQRLTYSDEYTPAEMSDILYAGLIGFLTGGVVETVTGTVTGKNKQLNAALRAMDEKQAAIDQSREAEAQTNPLTDALLAQEQSQQQTTAQPGTTVENTPPVQAQQPPVVQETQNAPAVEQQGYAGLDTESEGYVRLRSEKRITSKTTRQLDALGKALGVRIQIADSVDGGTANAEYNSGTRTITIAADADDPLSYAAFHEAVHHIRATDADSYNALAEAVNRVLGENAPAFWQTITRTGSLYGVFDESTQQFAPGGMEYANEEVVAQGLAYVAENTNLLNSLAQSDRSTVRRILDAVTDMIERVRGYTDGGSVSETDMRQFRELDNALNELKAALESALQSSGLTSQGEIKQSKKTPKVDTFTDAETTTVRSIGKKSLNSLTPGEHDRLERIAGIYWRDLGEKSPFFRSWFGDWRKNDQTPIKIANQISEDRGPRNNEDTGWSINVSWKVADETNKQNAKWIRKARSYLPYIGSIVENAVLLDSWGIGKMKSPNSLMMHSMYAVADDGAGPVVVKLLVEEMNDPNIAGTAKRAYQLQNIEIYRQSTVVGSSTQNAYPSPINKTADANTVADLYAIVKGLDPDFSPNEPSAITDDDGRPLVMYHGTRAENGDFYTFDYSKAVKKGGMGLKALGQGNYFTSTKLTGGERYGSRIIDAYLNIKNPFVYQNGSSIFEQVGQALGADVSDMNHAQLQQLMRNNGYDGVVQYDADGNISIAVTFDSEQIKSASENVGTFDGDNPDIRYSRKRQDGDGPYHPINSRAQEETKRNRGRDPVQVPTRNRQGRLTSKTLSTLANANMTSNEVVDSLWNDYEAGKFSRIPYSDKAAAKNARNVIRSIGWDEALEKFKSDIRAGKASKDITTTGVVLYNNAVNAGDVVTAMELATLIAKSAKSTAQAQQALNMINKLSPEGRFYAMVKGVEQIQQDLIDKFGNNAPNIEVDPSLLSEYRDALMAGDKETAAAVYEDIKWDISEQLPTTFVEKLNAWRYLSMLGNSRTQIRNIAGNLGFVPLRVVKNGFAMIGESFLPEGVERTKAIIDLTLAEDRALVQAAWMDYANVEDAIMSGGKLGSENLRSDVEKNKQIFSSAVLEGARITVDEMMNFGDTLFSKPTYCEALAMYLKANGWTAADFYNGNMTDAEIARAREVAIREAARATYRDTNAITEAVNSATSGIKQLAQKKGAAGTVGKALNVLVEGVLPFKKTPANVLARAIDYSPAGIIKGIVQMKQSVRDGNVTAAEAIDSLAAGTTGTIAMALGAFLRSIGVLSGGEGEDEKQAGFDALQGKQPYAMSVGSKNFTIDWAGPAVVSMLVGAEIFDASQDKGLTFRETVDSIMGLADPIVEMSFLSGLQDLMETGKYGDASLASYLATAATSYLSQYVPTLFGQIERTMEEGRQETYRYNDEHSDVLGPTGQRFLGQLMNKVPDIGDQLDKVPGFEKMVNNVPELKNLLDKIPRMEYNQIDYVDAWGRTTDYGNPLMNALNQFINPSYMSDERVTEVDNELQRLYDAGQGNVLPQRRSQSDTIAVRDEEGNIVEERHLTAEEYEQYNRTKGQTSLKLVTQLMDSTLYSRMNDDEKAKAIGYIYSYAKAVADREAEPTSTCEKWITEAMESSDPGKYIQLYSATQNLEPVDGKKTVSNWQKFEAIVQNTTSSEADEYLPYFMSGEYPARYEQAREIGFSPDRFVEFYKAYNTITGDKDRNGDTIPGSKKKKLLEWALSQGYGKDHFNYMYGLLNADTKDIDSYNDAWRNHW